MHDISVRTDQVIGKLFQFLDGKVGMQNVLVVMTADHGVSPIPEVNQARKMPGGRMPGRIVRDGLPYAPRPFISIALLRDRAHRVGTDSP